MAKTCLERFNQIVKICRIIAFLCGADIFDPNYKMSFLTWTVIIAINLYFICTIYTMYVGVVIDGNWKVILESLSLAGSAMQGYKKLLAVLHRQKVMVALVQYLTNIYKEYQQKDQSYKTALKYRIDFTSKMLKIDVCIYIVGVSIVILFPFIYGFIYGEKLFVMQFLLPGIDPNTSTGYIVLNSFQIFLICLGAFGNFAGDFFIFIFIINIPLLKDILKIRFKDLNEVILRTHDPKQTTPLMKKIVKYHLDYIRFIQEVEDVYDGVIFVQIFTAVISICCTLFSIAIGSWPAGFAYLIYSFIMFYAYCGLGHLVEISNDEVIDIIYSDCLWYELTLPEQKLVLLMIRKSQNYKNLTVGQIMPLSMSTALQLTKAIYSYMMMLLNFLEADEINDD